MSIGSDFMGYYPRLRDLREDKDLLQKDIAKILCISQQQYSNIELELFELSYDGLIKLSKFYKVSIDYILYQTDVRTPYPESIMNERKEKVGT